MAMCVSLLVNLSTGLIVLSHYDNVQVWDSRVRVGFQAVPAFSKARTHPHLHRHPTQPWAHACNIGVHRKLPLAQLHEHDATVGRDRQKEKGIAVCAAKYAQWASVRSVW